MLSKIPKVLHDFRGIPMISSVINNALKLNPEKLILVLGYKSKQVKEVILNHGNLGNVDFVYQKKVCKIYTRKNYHYGFIFCKVAM